MLQIHNWHTKRKNYGLSSSGQPDISVNAIYFGDLEICNAKELVEWDKEVDRVQLFVCEACGTPNCQSGGWVTLRRLNDYVFWIPAFKEILSGDDFALNEYGPPYFMRKHGALCFSLNEYERFQTEFSSFPYADELPVLTQNEVFRVYQCETPARMLGDLCNGDNSIKLDLILAADGGEVCEWRRVLQRLLNSPPVDNKPARLSPPKENDKCITLYLDLASFPEWKAFWVGSSLGLYISENLKLEFDQVMDKMT